MSLQDITDVNTDLEDIYARAAPTAGDSPPIEEAMLEKMVAYLVAANPPITTHAALHKAEHRMRREFKCIVKKSRLLTMYKRMRAMGHPAVPKARPELAQLLVKKAGKSHSGVLVITVLTSPYPKDERGKKQRFSCQWNCYYCPNEPGQPRSYLQDEPSVLRANRNGFDPVLQFHDRAATLAANGHPVDKIELLVLGGTWASYPDAYQESFIRDLFYAANTFWEGPKPSREPLSLAEEQRLNEAARSKIIGLTLETRPDCINSTEIAKFRRFGCTRVQLGIQHTDDRLLRIVNRGCRTRDTVRAIRQLLDCGYKVDGHFMPDLPGTTPAVDTAMFRYVLYSPDIRVDQMKIYPHAVVPWTITKRWLEEGKHTPFAPNVLAEVLLQFKARVHPWIRLNRVIRDIPSHYISGGCDVPNMRQVLLRRMAQENIKCHCIRCREVRLNARATQAAELVERRYAAAGGTEVFLSFETQDRATICGFLRLRLTDAGGVADEGSCDPKKKPRKKKSKEGRADKDWWLNHDAAAGQGTAASRAEEEQDVTGADESVNAAGVRMMNITTVAVDPRRASSLIKVMRQVFGQQPRLAHIRRLRRRVGPMNSPAALAPAPAPAPAVSRKGQELPHGATKEMFREAISAIFKKLGRKATGKEWREIEAATRKKYEADVLGKKEQSTAATRSASKLPEGVTKEMFAEVFSSKKFRERLWSMINMRLGREAAEEEWRGIEAAVTKRYEAGAGALEERQSSAATATPNKVEDKVDFAELEMPEDVLEDVAVSVRERYAQNTGREATTEQVEEMVYRVSSKPIFLSKFGQKKQNARAVDESMLSEGHRRDNERIRRARVRRAVAAAARKEKEARQRRAILDVVLCRGSFRSTSELRAKMNMTDAEWEQLRSFLVPAVQGNDEVDNFPLRIERVPATNPATPAQGKEWSKTYGWPVIMRRYKNGHAPTAASTSGSSIAGHVYKQDGAYVTPPEAHAPGMMRGEDQGADEPDRLLLFPELEDAALVRELHVYGLLTAVSAKAAARPKINAAGDGEQQHVGFGRRMMRRAEEIARAHGKRRIAVISGIGVRGYYRKLGYELDPGLGGFMIKDLELDLELNEDQDQREPIISPIAAKTRSPSPCSCVDGKKYRRGQENVVKNWVIFILFVLGFLLICDRCWRA